MKTVCDKGQCCGCMACVDICPKNAIQIEDRLLEYDAVIDENECVECNLCHKICHVNNLPQFKKPIFWRQGWANCEKQREKSSSGGVASAIEKAFIKGGGIVCSCVFKNGDFKFEIAETMEEQEKFVGSKYVKSNPSGCYESVKNNLEKGKMVLFVGLPCQVAAIKNYIKPALKENLYTIDLICHGTPSKKILDKFLNQYNTKLSDLNTVEFRIGNRYKLCKDGKEIGLQGCIDKYSMSFLNSLIQTENCYSCAYAKTERVSDITLGDSWGSKLPILEQKKGISLILCQDEKGKKLLEKADICLVDVDIENAIKNNKQLNGASIKSVKRERFFKLITKNKMNIAVSICYPKQSIKRLIKAILIKIRIIRV